MDVQHNYYIDHSKYRVQLWSKERLPFQPTNLKMKQELRSRLEAMVAPKNTILYACYSSSINQSFDVENILFYNVGPSSFSSICKDKLIFERSFDAPPPIPQTQREDIRFPHYQCYNITTPPSVDCVWEKKKTIAEWNDATFPRLTSYTKPYEVWHSMKQDKISLLDENTVESFFGLEINLQLPDRKSVNLVALLKPLLDGIIASFHLHDGHDIDEITGLLSGLLCDDKKNIRDKLINNRNAILGQRRLVFRYRGSVKWDPADTNLIFCRIVATSASGHEVRHSGSLFEVEKKAKG